MATPIIMPKFGQMTEESAIVEWLKQEGDKVAKGDILFTVETDKSVMEVESFEEGTLLKIVVKPGVNEAEVEAEFAHEVGLRADRAAAGARVHGEERPRAAVRPHRRRARCRAAGRAHARRCRRRRRRHTRIGTPGRAALRRATRVADAW